MVTRGYDGFWHKWGGAPSATPKIANEIKHLPETARCFFSACLRVLGLCSHYVATTIATVLWRSAGRAVERVGRANRNVAAVSNPIPASAS